MKRLLTLSLVATLIFSVIFCLPANADATATYKPTSTNYSMNVTLFCSPYGILS